MLHCQKLGSLPPAVASAAMDKLLTFPTPWITAPYGGFGLAATLIKHGAPYIPLIKSLNGSQVMALLMTCDIYSAADATLVAEAMGDLVDRAILIDAPVTIEHLRYWSYRYGQCREKIWPLITSMLSTRSRARLLSSVEPPIRQLIFSGRLREMLRSYKSIYPSCSL